MIWPENSTDIDPFRDAETREVIEEAVDAVDVPILVGAILDGPGDDYRRTAGVLWDPGPARTSTRSTSSATRCRSASTSRSGSSCCR